MFFSQQTCPAAVALGALFQTRHHVWNVTLVLVDDLDFGHQLVVLGLLGVAPQGVERAFALCEGPKQRVLDVCRGAEVGVGICLEKWNVTRERTDDKKKKKKKKKQLTSILFGSHEQSPDVQDPVQTNTFHTLQLQKTPSTFPFQSQLTASGGSLGVGFGALFIMTR